VDKVQQSSTTNCNLPMTEPFTVGVWDVVLSTYLLWSVCATYPEHFSFSDLMATVLGKYWKLWRSCYVIFSIPLIVHQTTFLLPNWQTRFWNQVVCSVNDFCRQAGHVGTSARAHAADRVSASDRHTDGLSMLRFALGAHRLSGGTVLHILL
jgi:hypothetical protein